MNNNSDTHFSTDFFAAQASSRPQIPDFHPDLLVSDLPHMMASEDARPYEPLFTDLLTHNPEKFLALQEIVVPYFAPFKDKLPNQSRFWIFRALAKPSLSETDSALIMERAKELCGDWLDLDIVEALCLVGRNDAGRANKGRNPNNVANEEKALEDPHLRTLIYEALSKIYLIDNRKTAANYFIGIGEEEKKSLAESILKQAEESLGEIIIKTSIGPKEGVKLKNIPDSSEEEQFSTSSCAP